MRSFRFWGLLVFGLGLIFIINISFGSVSIPLKSQISILLGQGKESSNWTIILLNYRIPKALTAVFVGGGLGVTGLVMQTYFRNPLAGPYVLGISSGASLGAALSLFASQWLTQSLRSEFGIITLASLGSFVVLLMVFGLAARVRDGMALLIIGLMFSSLTASVVSLMAFFSEAQALQKYVFWSYGNLGGLNSNQLGLLCTLVGLGVLMVFLLQKTLNGLLLGEREALTLGINLKTARTKIIFSTGIIAGVITAFVGPIAFVGLAVAHLSKQLLKTLNHKILIPATFIIGAIVMLMCDTIAQWPGNEKVLPINAITSIFGAPWVIWLLVKQRKLFF